MANDALDPGPDGSYPFVPRNTDGTIDSERFPEKKMRHRGKRSRDGRPVVIDTTPRHPSGEPQVPADIPREGDTP